MDVTYKVKLTTQAIEELDRAAQYIAYEMQQPQIAEQWLDAMQDAFRSLAYFPGKYPMVDEEPFAALGVHKMKVKNTLVYYIIKQEQTVVWITAIVYAKRNQIAQLLKMNFDETE